MFRFYLWSIGLGTLFLTASTAPAADPAPAVRHAADARALAAKIDALIAARWTEKEVKPAAVADDAEFLRRVYLDLAGRIPRVMEVREFLADPSADKREKLVDRLLESPYYVIQFTNVWRDQMLPRNNNPQLAFVLPNLEIWLRARLRDNTPYDQLVRELLTTPINNAQVGRGIPAQPGANPTPLSYYQGNEFKPEVIAAATSRMFLGVKLECAQCHDHPFATWSRKQFWEYAAFFAGIQPASPNNPFAAAPEKADLREIKIGGTDTVVQARFLDGTEPQWRSGMGTRGILAEWLTRADNPFFARTAANRLWAHFMGIGIMEPVDEPSDDNPPSHPELLDELARQLAAHQFDLKFLIKAIVLSKTYKRSSVAENAADVDPRLFARMTLKGLTPEQLFDSLAQATGYREAVNPNARFGPQFAPGSARAEFLTKFASQGKRTEHQTSILQALALMNGRFISDVTSLERSETLAAVIDNPFMTDAQRIETLYLATLTRKPTARESERLLKYVEAGGAKGDTKAALTDVFWALLNSSEFILNH
jgi:hypothetical protein